VFEVVDPDAPSSLAPALETNVEEPWTVPVVKRRRLQLPGEGEMNRSAADGPVGDWRISFLAMIVLRSPEVTPAILLTAG